MLKRASTHTHTQPSFIISKPPSTANQPRSRHHSPWLDPIITQSASTLTHPSHLAFTITQLGIHQDLIERTSSFSVAQIISKSGFHHQHSTQHHSTCIYPSFSQAPAITQHSYHQQTCFQHHTNWSSPPPFPSFLNLVSPVSQFSS